MRTVNSKSLVDVVNEECRMKPVLFVPEVGSLLEEVSKIPELDVSNFDRDTRYRLERDLYGMSLKKLYVIYARRFIAALAFDKLIPTSVPHARSDAAFAFDKAAGASYYMLSLVGTKERIPCDIRGFLNRLRAIKIFNELCDTRNAYYSCVYMFNSALSAERASRLHQGELPPNWTQDMLKEYVLNASDLAWKLREESRASGKIVELHDSLNANFS